MGKIFGTESRVERYGRCGSRPIRGERNVEQKGIRGESDQSSSQLCLGEKRGVRSDSGTRCGRM